MPHVSMLRLLTACVLPVLAALLLAAPAHAQSVLYVDGSANGANNGTSWADAYTNVQTAIDNASATDQIWIAEGTYKPTGDASNRDASFTIPDSKDGLKLYGGFQGEATETSLADRDPDAHEVVLSGDIDGVGDRAFAPTEDSDGIPETATATDHIDFRDEVNTSTTPNTFFDGANSKNVVRLGGGITAATVIDGVTITGGFATVPDYRAVDNDLRNGGGGGLFCDGCSATFRGVTFKGNYALFEGGGVFIDGGGSPTFVNTVFWGNSAGGSSPSADPSDGTSLERGLHRDDYIGEKGGLSVRSGSATLTHVTFLQNSINDNYVEQTGAGDVLSGSGVTVQNGILTSGCPSGATCQNTVSSDLDLSGLRPGPQSSAIGAGDPSFLPEDSEDLDDDGDTTEPLPLDAGGEARVQLGFPDAGAFETDHQFFSPATAAVAPGETLVITGQRLDQVTAVAVNGTNAPDFTSVSAQRLEATVPQDATTGPVTLTIDGTDLDTDEPMKVIDAYGPGRALGNNATVELPDESAFDFTSSFTVSAWIRGEGRVEKGSPADPFFRLVRGTFEVDGKEAFWDLEDNPATDGAWHHVTGVYDEQADEVRVYVDGEQSDASGTLLGIGEPSLNDKPVTILTGSGSVDNVRFYTRALSAGEIQDLARRHRRLDLSESKADGLLASYRFDASGGTAYDYAGRRSGTYTSGGPTAFSTAPIGIEQGTTVGPAGAQLASNVAAYRYGRLGGPARTDDDLGEAFSTEILTEPTERAPITWGLIEDAGSTTIDYSNVGLSAPVGLLYRTGPGDDWEVADGWTRDADAKTFTADSAPAGEYAVASFPTADLALTFDPGSQQATSGDNVSTTATVTNNGPDAVPAGETVTLITDGLSNVSASGGSFSGGTWTLGEIANGASATLDLSATIDGSTPAAFLNGTLNAPDVNGSNNTASASFTFPPYGAGDALTLDGAQDGSGAYAESPSNALDPTSSFSAEAWIRWDGSDGFRVFLSKPDGSSSSGFAFVVQDGILRANLDVGEENRIVRYEDEAIPADEWIHAATTYDGTVQTLYVNGERVVSTDHGSEAFPADSGQPLLIGREFLPGYSDDRAFPGEVDQVRTWGQALTQDQIQARMHRTIEPGADDAEHLTASYRFDGESTTTAVDYVGSFNGTLQNGATRSTFSGAQVGQQSALATSSSDASIGPSGSALSASDVSGDPVQLYRYGAEDGAVRDDSDAADDFSALPDFISERSDLVWGISAPKDASPSATLTLDYSHVGTAGPLAAPVNLLHREHPGDPWEVATGWTKDPAAQTFTHTGAAPTGQYALAEFNRADLAVSLAPENQDVRIGDDAAFTVTVTNTGPDAAPAGTAVALTAGTGLADPEAVSAPANGSYDADSATWTLDALDAGASDTLAVAGTYDAADPAALDAALTPPSDIVDPDTGNHTATAEVELAIERFHVDASSGDDSNDGESWGQAFATFTKALDAAQTQDTIWVAQGTYRPDEGPGVTSGNRTASFTVTGAQDGLHVYGGFENGDAFADRDPVAHPTVLSGNIGTESDSTDNSYTVLHLDGTSEPITRSTRLDGLTVTNGTANGAETDGDLTQQGAGIFCNGNGGECSPALSNLRVTDNASTSWGAGIMIDGTSGEADPLITGTVIAGNRSTFEGGGLFVKATGSQPDLHNTVIANNEADQNGGGLFVRRSARTDLINVTFAGNTATEGGAIYNQLTSGSTGPVLQNSLLWNNGDTNSGAEIVSDDASATLSNTLIAGGISGIVEKDGATTTDDGGNLSSDPLFVNPADPNGFDDAFGTADDGLRVASGSPALDAGDDSALPADTLDLNGDDDTSESLPVDLTGADRVQDGTVDLGAYEGGTPALAFDSFAPSVAAPGETVTVTGSRLTNTSEVTIGGTDASFTVESSTEVTVTVPEGASTGPVELTANGQTVSGSSDLGVVGAPYGAENALAFDGATDGSGAYVEAPTDVLDTTAPFTVEAWIRWDGSDGFRAFFSKPDGSTSSGVALVVFDGELRAGVDVGGENRRVSLASTPANEWIHVATTYDGTEQALYVNGAQVDASSYGSEAFTAPSNEPVFIGREFAPGFLDDRTFPGQIDQVRTWNAALTQEQIRARMHQTIESDAAASDDLVASYRFDAGTGTTAYDYAGSLPGTLQNGAAWQSFSGANVGQEQAVATDAQSASVGPSNATLSVENVSSGDTVQVYRYGTADDPLRSDSDPGESFGGVSSERSNLTWGLATPKGMTPTADLTLDYSGASTLPDGDVMLVRRDRPGTDWTQASEWTHDKAGQTFTFSGAGSEAVPTGEYAIADAPSQVATNDGLTLDQGTFATLTQSDLETTDPNDGPGDLEYTITSGPDNGTLLASGQETNTFSQQDINDGTVVYVNDGTDGTDSFDFDVSDGAETLTGTFTVDVDPDDAYAGSGLLSVGGDSFSPVPVGDTGALLVPGTLSGSGQVHVVRYNDTPTPTDGMSEPNVGDARYVLRSIGGASINEGAPFIINADALPHPDPSSVTLYARDTEGSGAFTSRSTDYVPPTGDAGGASNVIFATISGFGEVATAATDVFTTTVPGTDGLGNDTGWRMLSAPANFRRIALEDDLDFNVEEGALLYTFSGGDADASNWRPGGGEGGVERGQGFVLYFFDDETDPLESDGIDLDIPVGDADQATDVPVPWLDVNDEFEVLGNPFDQSIPFSNLKQTTENGGGSLADAGFQASAITWNGAEGRYDTIVPGDDLPPYTGIVLQRATVGTGDNELVFTAPSGTNATATADAKAHTARHDTTNRVEQRPSMAATSDAGGRIQLSVQVDGATQHTGGSAGATVWVGTDATEGWDAYDFGALPPPATDTYVQAGFPLERSAGSNDLVERVVASEPLGEAQAVDLNLPLSVRGVNMDGSAEIAWPAEARAETPDDWTVELVDTQPGGGGDPVVHNLRTEGAYPFDLSEDGAVDAPEEARFRLRISAAPLPVELAGFEARRARDEAVTLQWETLSETNNAGFEVQRRAVESEHGSDDESDVETSWQAIAMVDGAGTTDTPQSYQFEDADLPYAADSLSYRLRQVDTDGTASVTEAVTIARPVTDAELLPSYPNPARSQATIRYAVPERQDVRIVLYDLLGRRVQTVVHEEAEGRTEQTIDVSRLASGTYFLRMQTEGHTETQRLTVVR